MAYTLNQFHNVFKTFAQNHRFVNSYGFGDLADIGNGVENYSVNKDNSTGKLMYPSMWITPQPSVIDRHFIRWKFNILFYDLVHKDDSNSIEVLSDTQQCAADLINYLRNPSYEDYFSIDNEYSFQITPFRDRFNDEVTGWMLDLEIDVVNLNDRCTIPIA